MKAYLRKLIFNYLKPRLFLFLIVGVVYGGGVLLGAVGVGFLTDEQVTYLTQLINNFLSHLQNIQIDDQAYIREVLGSIWRDLGLIYFLSFTVIGLPGIFVIIFLRGFLLGFVLGFFIQQMAFDGMIFASLAIVPQSLITIPVYLTAGVTAIEFSWFLLRRFWHFPKIPLRPYVLKISVFMLFLGLVASVGGLVEVYVTPVFMKLVAASIAK